MPSLGIPPRPNLVLEILRNAAVVRAAAKNDLPVANIGPAIGPNCAEVAHISCTSLIPAAITLPLSKALIKLAFFLRAASSCESRSIPTLRASCVVSITASLMAFLASFSRSAFCIRVSVSCCSTLVSSSCLRAASSTSASVPWRRSSISCSRASCLASSLSTSYSCSRSRPLTNFSRRRLSFCSSSESMRSSSALMSRRSTPPRLLAPISSSGAIDCWLRVWFI